MTEVFTAMLGWLTYLFDTLMSKGGLIGVAIVCWPVYVRIVRVLRSIIKK